MAKTVILIDDDQDDLDIIKETLNSIDPSLHCISFIYPIEAIRVISTELIMIPDYIITDINMPGMTGDQCVRELRGRKEFGSTIITVLSTAMHKTVSEALKDLGANYTFQKPNSIEAYKELLSEMFEGQRKPHSFANGK
jgi:CheY-like chemotaxis protein